MHHLYNVGVEQDQERVKFVHQDDAAAPEEESVWDYPRPPRLEVSRRHIQVICSGVMIADSTHTQRILETSHPPAYYIPPADVRMEYLKASSHSTFCEWKGVAAYYDIAIDGRRLTNAAWYYRHPNPAYTALKDFIAFYPGSMDACLVDGERVQPEAGSFYGGWITKDIRLR